MKEESKFKVGDITNKGTVDKIYSFKDISINGELYDLSKHNIKLLKEGQMLLKLIDAVEAMTKAKEKYENHPGGGASQKIKNQLYQNYKVRFTEMNNVVFNIKQLLK